MDGIAGQILKFFYCNGYIEVGELFLLLEILLLAVLLYSFLNFCCYTVFKGLGLIMGSVLLIIFQG